MKATGFEYRHQTLVHQLIVGLGALTYLFDREDVVWRFVKNTQAPHTFERYAFIVAALFIATGAVVCTRARACAASGRSVRPSRYFGDLLYAVGLASLLPVLGFVILVLGDAVRVYRLSQLAEEARSQQSGESRTTRPAASRSPAWKKAFRREAVKWGILLSMIVFSTTLVDRQADILVVASFLVGLLLNSPAFRRTAA